MTDDSEYMRRALGRAAQGPRGINPQVGCVIVNQGRIVGEGHHQGAGTAHAEVNALAQAGADARGATAYVTLEPCAHTGRTGPCTQALIDAGIGSVIYALEDPTDLASGGAYVLAAAGVDVSGGLLREQSRALLSDWLHVQATHRPYVVLKMATSLDGRVDDRDGCGRRITGAAASHYVHALRAACDAVAVGTGTALADDPALTVRGAASDAVPWRIVLGASELSDDARVRGEDGRFLQIPDHDPEAALRAMAGLGITRVLLEGGPTVASHYLSAAVVDEVHWLTAPLLLGAGPQALAGLPGSVGLDVRSVSVIGEDVCIVGSPRTSR